MPAVTLTREELYALVWSEPIQKLATRFNISDRGLGKLCERHAIPVPPRGWWAKKASGKRVKQDPLPPLEAGKSTHIRIEGQRAAAPAEPRTELAPLPPEIAFERHPVNAIVVDENMRITHPLVRDAAKELRSRPADTDGLVHTSPGCVDVRVGKPSITRATRILQALFEGFKKRQYPISIKEGKTYVTVLGEPFRIRMGEHVQQTLRELTADEHRRRRAGELVNPYIRRPSGVLTLNAIDTYPEVRLRDGKRRRLEDSLNLFIETLVERAYREKTRRAERELEAKRREEAERQRKEQEKRQREHQQAIARFDVLAEAWTKTEQRRAFLAKLREACGVVGEDTELARWLKVAEDWTEVSDPLVGFREPRKVLKLYFAASKYQLASIRRDGFSDPDPPSAYSRETSPPPGVKLTDRAPQSDWGSEVLELELHEDVALPYEVTEPGYVPRTFYVLARVLNGALAARTQPTAAQLGEEEEDYSDDP